MEGIAMLVAVYVGTLLWGSFGEWGIHRFVMHQRRWLLPYPYELHAIGHHGMFRADETYHALDDEMKKHVTFDPKDYFFILLAHVPMLLGFEWISGVALAAPVGGLAVLSYGVAFDVLHWCYHVPANRWVERRGWFRWLKENHRLHHERQDRRFNVVFPLADAVLGTLK
jgi:hypothetical protein